MLVLTADHLINRGANRDCYRHPDDPNRCIKLNRSDGQGTHDNTNAIEYEHHTALSDRLGEAFYQHAPRGYGLVETNLGKGPCFELIRDSDGALSTRLSQYITEASCTPQHAIELIDRLYDFVMANNIGLFDVNPYNLLVRRGAEGQTDLIVIDWKGPKALREFIPASRLIPWFARMKKARRFQRLREQVKQMMRDYPISHTSSS